MQLESVLVGIIISSGIMFIYQKITDYGSYLNFRSWCKKQNITEEELNKQSIPKYYAMWRLSQLDGVQIVECKDDKDALRK
jgi:ribosome-associated toxin RatA of RatAB toxin-antitoxin module